MGFMIDSDHIECALCGRQLKVITNTHLKTHNITGDEYREKYGERWSENTRKIISELNKKRPKSLERNKKISATLSRLHAQGILTPWNKGKSYSDEIRKKISMAQTGKKWTEERKRRFGELRRGTRLSDETRKKISLSLTKNKISKEQLEDLYWKQGLTLREIGNKFGLSLLGVYYYMKKYGIPRRIRGYAPKPINLVKEKTLAYILGVVLGDGNKNLYGYRYTIDLNVKQKEFAASFAKAIEDIGLHTWRGYKKTNYKGESRYYHRVIVCSKSLYQWLCNVKVDEFIFKNKNNMKYFTKGIYESEGSISKRCFLLIGVSDEKLINLTRSSIEKLGFKTNVYHNDGFYQLYLLGGKKEVKRFLWKINPSIKKPPESFFEYKEPKRWKYPSSVYARAIELRNERKWGPKNIGQVLGIPHNAVKHWIYEARVPKEVSLHE
jgi:hypothetical protein